MCLISVISIIYLSKKLIPFAIYEEMNIFVFNHYTYYTHSTNKYNNHAFLTNEVLTCGLALWLGKKFKKKTRF